jgi:uncharacterized protein
MVNYKIDAISIGNGTASPRDRVFIKKIAFDKPIQIFIVSEAEPLFIQHLKLREFPNYDVFVVRFLSGDDCQILWLN